MRQTLKDENDEISSLDRSALCCSYTYTKFYLFKAQLRRYSSQAIKKQNTYQLCPYMGIRYKPQFDNS